MIYIFTGKTGSGKTYQMIKTVYPLWLKGVDIYSNTYLEFEKFGGSRCSNICQNSENFSIFEKFIYNIKKVFYNIRGLEIESKTRGNIIYYEDITELISIKNGIIILDEGQALMDSKSWESLPRIFSNKLRQHRKHKLDLYTTTQNVGTIDKDLRRLVQHWVHVTDVFALFWKRNPSWLTIHKSEIKDVDELYGNVEDLNVTTLKTDYFLIHKYTKKLYDTMYDIGFTVLKSIWLNYQGKETMMIIPKEWNLAKLRQQLSHLKFFLNRNY